MLSVAELAAEFDLARPISIRHDIMTLGPNTSSLREQLTWMSKTALLKHVVIVGIRGFFSDMDGGIYKLLEHLQERLKSIEELKYVRDESFVRLPWNRDVSNPSEEPETDRHLSKIKAVTRTPSYVVLFGHSFGAWSVCKVSRQLPWSEYQTADFVATIDPVFGPLGDSETRVKPRGRKLKNWYQRTAIFLTSAEQCAGRLDPTNNNSCLGPLPTPGIACGRKLDTDDKLVEYEKKENGDRERIDCPWPIPNNDRMIAHDTIDGDKHIRFQIEEQIIADLFALIGIVPTDQQANSRED